MGVILVVCLFGAMPLSADTGVIMNENNMLVINQDRWYESHANSPEVKPDSFSLDFALKPAVGPQGPTVVLFGSARLPGSLGDIYGGQVIRAINIIMINMKSGKVYYNHAGSPDAVPLYTLMNTEGEQDGSSGRKLISVTVHFNLDLGSHLFLPGTKDTYAVFLNIDDMVSEIKQAVIPENPDRIDDGTLYQQMVNDVIDVTDMAKSKFPEDLETGDIILTGPEKKEDNSDKPVFPLTVQFPSGIPEQEPGLDDNELPQMLYLVIMGYLSREIGHVKIPLPDGEHGFTEIHMSMDVSNFIHSEFEQDYVILAFMKNRDIKPAALLLKHK